MTRNTLPAFAGLITSLLLAACTPEAPPAGANATTAPAIAVDAPLLAVEPTVTEPAAVEPAAPVVAMPAPPALPGAALPLISVATLMKDSINPSAQALWRAVSYVVSADGATETKPETEADWQKLREQADALMKAGATLMLPGLRANDDPSAQRANYQNPPADVERLMQMNKLEWNDYARNMQTATIAIMATIDKRDVTAFTEAGPPLNQVCETCHAQFWYKQPGAQ